MTATLHSPLLSNPPLGRHIAQFHRTPESLVDAVAFYLAEGLRRGEPVVAILEEQHLRPVLARLKKQGLDPSPAVLRDAGETLERFMIGDHPDSQRFRGLFDELFAAASRISTRPVRLYGEMVNLLWRQGRTQAAIRLENLWNETIREHPVRLFCCYLVDFRDANTYRHPVHEIGHVHSDILPTDEDDRLHRALDAACRETFGVPLERIMERASDGEGKPAVGPRAVLWIFRHLPGSIIKLICRARELLECRPPNRGTG